MVPEHAPNQIKKSIQTHETAPFFLYNPIKTATYSLHTLSLQGMQKISGFPTKSILSNHIYP